MTRHPIRTEPDGTRVYSNGSKYRPVPDGERIYARRKPDAPGAQMYNREWVLPLAADLPPEDERGPLPDTRPDTDAYLHAAKPRKCTCRVCRRPEAKAWKRKWKRDLRRQLRQMRMADPSGSLRS